MRFHMFAMLGLLAPMLVSAQTTGTVQGTVTDAGNGQPRAAAQARIECTVMGALSDAAGGYSIPSVPTGPRAVIARRIGSAESSRGDGGFRNDRQRYDAR